MKKFIVSLIAAFIFAVPLSALAAPQDDYTIVRIRPNGSEQVLGTVDWTVEQDQVFREVAFAAARQNRTNNPAWHIVIYCPTDNPDGYTVDDICWDSQTDQ